jgi:hypothetical protein
MSFDDEVLARTKHSGTPCPVGVALDALDAADRAQVEQVLANPERVSVAIAAALANKSGVRMTSASVIKHRAGRCYCAAMRRLAAPE